MPRARRSVSDATLSARSSTSPYPTQSSSGASSPKWSPDASTPPPELEAESPPANCKSRNVRTETQQENVVTSRRHMSCENCRLRKTKCSRQSPCTACHLRGESCTWIGPPPAGESGPDALQASLDEVVRLKKLVDVLLDRLQQQDEDRLDGRQQPAQNYYMHQYEQRKSAPAFASTQLPPAFSGLAFPSVLPPQIPSVLGSEALKQQLVRGGDATVQSEPQRRHESMATLARAAKAVDSSPFSRVEEH